ncbi:carbohydrate ABC transporter permease [Jiangella asiatica]|uniref:Carbohydrate ABC transporter permease n=1 Tax=Jiangella asiatica TaxID=2530372 RepID=A0A4R5D833_9ACTN|nr:carbohydrate ABC transporter permease [Jiangella asiatica]TDE09699.1 carbohydrate ABC transporter permease [Jiangella asiatica]
MRTRTRRRPDWKLSSALGIVTLVFLAPLLWVLLLALRPQSEALSSSPLPSVLTLENLHRALSRGSLVDLTQNSTILCVAVCLVVVPLSLLAGYAFARFRFKGRNLLLFVFMFSLAVPGLVNLIAIYQFYAVAGLINNPLGLIMVDVAAALPLATWLIRSFVLSIPVDMEEAATIDGCSRLGAAVRILLPLTGPVVAAVLVIVFVTTWQEFIVAQTLMSDPSMGVVSQGLLAMQGEYSTDMTGLAAGAVFISVVPVALFLLLQRRFVDGMTAGAQTG